MIKNTFANPSLTFATSSFIIALVALSFSIVPQAHGQAAFEPIAPASLSNNFEATPVRTEMNQVIAFQPGAHQPDYSQLFSSSGEWPVALAHVSELDTNPNILASESDEELAQEAALLKANHIELNVIISPVPAFFPPTNLWECNSAQVMTNIANTVKAAAQLLHNLKVNVGRLVLDEPLWWAHYYQAGSDGTEGCQFPIDTLAAMVAQSVNVFRSVYPNVRIVDTEPVCGLNYSVGSQAAQCPQPSLTEFNQWVSDLQTDLGRTITERLDVQWGRDWQPSAQALLADFKQIRMPYGVFYNQLGQGMTAAQWIAGAQANTATWVSLFPRQQPFEVVITGNWESNAVQPALYALPESDPTTLTSLVDWYCVTGPYAGHCKSPETVWEEHHPGE